MLLSDVWRNKTQALVRKRNAKDLVNNEMQTLKSLLIIFILTNVSVVALSQCDISGRVTDGHQNLPSATAILLTEDSTFVIGVVTDSVGRFSFDHVKPGTYRISASMIGYAKHFSDVIAVYDKNIKLNDIILQESAIQLNDLIVQGNKNLIDQKIDRQVINLGSSITFSGNSVLEVLAKCPGIIVNRQNNTIAMNGRSGVRVMIDDKLMQVPIEVVIQMLDGMNASNVEKIELITSPPSEYDAEGNAGIINLVTKREQGFGTNGSFGLVAGARWAEAFGGNFSVNHRNKRIAFFADYSILTNHNLHIYESETRSYRYGFTQNIYGYSHRENFTIQQNLNAGLEWKIGQSALINVLFTGYRRNWNLEAHTDDVNQIDIDSTISTSMAIEEKNLWQSSALSVGIKKGLSSRSDINFNADYLYYHNDNPSTYDNTVRYDKSDVGEPTAIALSKTTPIRFLVAKVDYTREASPSMLLEIGVKGVVSNLDNDVLAQRSDEGVWMTDPLFTSFSNLKERIYAGYISTKWQPGTHWQINSGLRYEYTQTDISTPSQKNLVDRTYGYFFPIVSVKRTIGAESDFQFSYSKRITRPTYNDIAPYVFFWGPRTFSAGNTSLYPAIADAFSAGYHVRHWLISLQYSHVRKEIVMMQPEVDSESGSLTYRSQNLRYLKSLSLVNAHTLRATSWWEIQSTITAQLQVARTAHQLSNVTQKLFGINLNVISQFKLPKNFSAEVSGTYQSNTLSGISEFLPSGSLNVGVQKNLQRHGIVRLSVDDMLNTNYWRLKTASTHVNSYFNYHWHNRFIRVSYTRNFGNSNTRSVKVKSVSHEERSRVTN